MCIVRIYFNDVITDIDIKDFESFSIGSGAKDSHIISDATIKSRHICFFKAKDLWKVKCDGETYFGNELIKLKEVGANDTYILNKDKKIAVSVIPVLRDSENIVDIAAADEVVIGRNSHCHIIFNNKMVSGNHAKIYKLGTEFHIADIKSTNGTFLNNKRIRDAVLHDNDIISIGIYKIVFRNGSLSFQNTGDDLTINIVSKQKATTKEYPYFVRSPRLKLEVPSGEIEIQAPPNLGTNPEINWLIVLLPPISMILIMVSIVAFTGGNAVSLMYIAPMSLIGIMVSVLSYGSQKKKHAQKEQLRLQRYNEHLQETIKEIEDKTRQQIKALSLVHPDTNECTGIVKNIERRLWERKPQDDDFMSLRVGSGIINFNIQLRIPKQTVHLEDDDLLNKPQEIENKYKYINGAPIVFDMLNFPSGGVVGNRQEGIHLIRNMIMQAATHHCYDELRIITIFPKSEMQDWDWIRWLPHSFNDNRSERYLAYDKSGATNIFKQFDEILSQRLREIKEDDDYRSSGFKLPYYLFIIADRALMEDQTIMKYLAGNNKKMGIGSLFLYDDISLLPRDCAVIIDVNNGGGIIYNKENASDKKEFKIDKVKDIIDAFSRALAPVRVNSMSEELMLPSCVTFLEGYGVKTSDEINIADNWENSLTYKSMAVPIGIKSNGDQFLFDIHEKHHGPHGLVAGMTGSGKSEMVQSWILSMALKFSPQDVSFVLIDFKGTGLILPFLNMPHLAGTISDLDTNINRNLIALENELSRRKALLDGAGVNNIINYLKLYRDGKAKEPLSFLFIVIDEFAEFKVQFPDFMTVVNRVFAIGRTLGVFAVLLTQKPAGVVDDKMHANTRFRWCLKVASTADSKDMIKHPDAAKIINPGRAYVQVGEDEVFELVQSYWSGAPYNPNKTTKTVAKPRISVVDMGGRRISYDTYEKTLGIKSELSEIDVIIQYMDKYVQDKGLAKAQKIWMQKLPNIIPLNAILNDGFDGEKWPVGNEIINPILGMLDDPHTQSQYPLRFNISEDGHHVIYGAPGTGKTTMLQTLIMSLVLSYTPQEVNIYIMDFGGWSMGIFKDFPHVGGVANDNDNERIEKTARLIIKELEQRKRKFAAEGVGNIVSYRESTNEIMPNILLVLDNFAPVINLYPNLEQFFINLTREGGNYGVYFVTSANNTMALGFKLGQNIKMAVSLQMTDKSDYSSIVGKTDGLEPEKTAGRGLAKGNPPLEFQTALPMEGKNESERVSKIKETAILMDKKWGGKKAKPIPIMPAIINFGTVETDDIAVGLTSKDVEPIGISFTGQHHIIISGKPMSGKSNLLKVITKQMKANTIVFDTGTALKSIEGICDQYITDVAEFDQFISDMVPILQQRKDEYYKDNSIQFTPFLILIDDLKQCFALIKDETAKRMEAIIRLGKGLNVNLLVAGNSDDVAKLYNQGEPFTMGLVNSQTNILLGGSFRDHNVFKANIPYSEQEVLLDEYEGYVIHREKALRFKAMYEL